MMTTPSHIAVIEIGTNTTKCLVIQPQEGKYFSPVALWVETTRIGEGLRIDGRLRDDAVDRTCRVILDFQKRSNAFPGCAGFIFSTYALREASNARRVLQRVERETGIPIRVLTGAEEARFAYLSAKRALDTKRRFTVLIDVGGGSTEIVVGRRGQVVRSVSVALGALHLTEEFVRSDPIEGREFTAAVNHIDGVVRRALSEAQIDNLRPRDFDLVGSGGTIATSWAMLAAVGGGESATRPAREESVEMPLAGTPPRGIRRGDFARLLDLCLGLSVEERRRLPGMHPERADIMPAGLAISLAWVRHTGKRVLYPNLGGVREGVAAHLVAHGLEW